jgi:DNA-binding MarR family transcriptional regulator
MPSQRPATDERAPAPALDAVAVLGRLSAVFNERRRQLAESVGLTDQQWQALEEIQTEHFMPSLFARERKSSAAAVSKILRQLTDKGLITASVSGDDARKRDYVVTGSGKRALDTLRAERRRAVERVWLSFDAAELEAWRDFGARLADRLERYAADNENPGSCVEQAF